MGEITPLNQDTLSPAVSPDRQFSTLEINTAERES
jgi:hypothetical protein